VNHDHVSENELTFNVRTKRATHFCLDTTYILILNAMEISQSENN